MLSPVDPPVVEFDKSNMKYRSITRYAGGGSNDLAPNLQRPDDPVPLLTQQIENHMEPHV